MANAITSLTAYSTMDLMPALPEQNSDNANLKGFDELLSNLLYDVTDSKEQDDETEINLSAFYSGLFGALLTARDMEQYSTPYTKGDLNNIDSKRVYDIALRALPESEQLLNLIDKLNNNNNNDINFEAFKRSFENNLAATENITYGEAKQLSRTLENLIKSNTGFDKGVVEFNKSYFLQDVIGLSSSCEGTQQGYKSSADILGKIINALNFKDSLRQGVKIEQANPDITLKGLVNETDIKVVSSRQNSNSLFNNSQEDINFQLNKSAESDIQNKEILESKQTFDLYIYQGKESLSGNNAVSIEATNDKLTEVIGNQIIKSAIFTEQSGKHEFEIQLKPDFLGRIVIKLQSGENGINVRISTSNIDVKEILSAQFPRMQEMLKNQGVDLQNAEIVYTGLANSNQDFKGDSRYKSTNKKSISQAKGEYERTIISGTVETIQSTANYNGAVNYLV